MPGLVDLRLVDSAGDPEIRAEKICLPVEVTLMTSVIYLFFVFVHAFVPPFL